MNILIVDDHPLFRHALIQAVRYSLPQAKFMKQLRLMSFMSVWKMGQNLIWYYSI